MSLPAITTDINQARTDIRSHGLALIEGQLTPARLELARAATYEGAAEDDRLGRRADSFGLDYGEGNVRVWNILNRHAVFQDMVQLPVVLELLKAVIGWPALLGNISANIAEPGSDGGMWHQDQLFVPHPWPTEPQGMNFAWLLDDFTADNGATEVIPASHGEEYPVTATLEGNALPVIAPAGTLMVIESRLLHRTGCNRSNQPRAGLFGWYTRPIYRPQENWFLSLDAGVIESASDELLTLLGYKTQGLGLVYGASPR
ncbi:MAG: phytanoyl-CoA dioxygenase family protein [Gammaproteobacteria bacterium]